MKITVEALPWVSETFGGKKTARYIFEAEAEEGATLDAFLRQLAREHPKFGAFMLDAKGALSDQVAVVVNNRLPDLLDGFATRLKAGDRVLLVQAYMGG